MPDDAGERTEAPTPRRRTEARERGQIPRSLDLTAALALLGGLVVLNGFGASMFGSMLALTRELGDARDAGVEHVATWLWRAAHAAATMTLPFLAMLAVLALVGGLLQTGGVVTWARLEWKLDALNPANGLRRLFSADSLQRLAMSVLKLGVVAGVAWFTVAGQVAPVLGSGNSTALGVLHMGCQLVFTLALRMALVLLLLGLVDYFYQWWRIEKSLKMTRQEVRDELKNLDGDPLMRQRRRQAHARLALQRLNQDVPKADVVVSNPTEFAVALRYVEGEMAAPRVIAKGQDLLALRIRQIAQRHRVPIVQRPPLARALYAAVDVGQEIPQRFYRAVAEVLAYVYQVSKRAG